jgi:hypothetical protein
MPIYFTQDGKLIAGYDNYPKRIYRPIISDLLIKKFGKGPFTTKQVTDALFFTMDWYVEQFLDILNKENELCFFQGLFMLHEYSCEFHRENPNKSPIPQITEYDFALYRRVLKLSLEQACDIPLKSGELLTPKYLKTKEKTIEEILYLGDFIYTCSNLLAYQHLVEDCIDLKYTKEDQYYFDYKHHYGFLIDEILKSNGEHLNKAVIGDNDFEDFIEASKACLDVDYDKAIATIQLIHENFESQGGKLVLDEWFIYPKNLEILYGIPFDKGEVFYKGLTLSKKNKMPLKEAVYKPQSINRYLYRPFLVWNVDGKDLTIVGDGIFIESISSLCNNAFGWNKYPVEWGNDNFKAFIKKKVIANDKILEDVAEKILKENNVIYDRNIKHLKKWNNQNINIDNEKCGELDFIFIYDGKIFVADSKHNTSRYDMNNFKNDYSSFETNKKSYNKTLIRKLSFLKDNMSAIEEHFQVILNNRDFNLNTSVLKGIFIINTPTFIMYNNQFRIYTIKSFEELVTGKYIDKSFQILIEEEDEDKFLFVKYPYFKKPNYFVFDPDD